MPRITCPNCAAGYDVPEGAIGPNGRKVRCRACGTSWIEEPRPLARPLAELLAESPPPPPPAPEPEDVLAHATPFPPRRPLLRGPVLLGLLVFLVLALGVAVALVAWGPRQVAGALGIADKPVPLGISITRPPDWRMIAGGSELFAVSGRIWNPTNTVQPVPDIRAELRDMKGRSVYSWIITRPVARLAPGQSAEFDGAAVDVPRASQRIAVTFATPNSR